MINKAHTDQELWARIRINDSLAFAELYDRYWLRLYKAALHYTKDEAISEDIVQDVFVIVWDKRESLNIEHFTTYLNTVMRYEVFRYLKKAATLQLDLDEKTAEMILQPSVNQGSLHLNEIDLETRLNDLLQTLPKRCREIFHMSKKLQLSNEEIAIKLGISKHTVENQLATAVKQLRSMLTRSDVLLLLLTVILENDPMGK